jgi:hypothetical protein
MDLGPFGSNPYIMCDRKALECDSGMCVSHDEMCDGVHHCRTHIVFNPPKRTMFGLLM